MQLKTANGEKLIKTWTYAQCKQDKTVTNHNITVTTKRVVISEESDKRVNRNELLLENIVGVSTDYAKESSNPKKSSGIILLILGIMLLVVGIVLSSLLEWWYGMGFILFAIVFVIIGIVFLTRKKLDCSLSLVITTNIPVETNRHTLFFNTVSKFKVNNRSTIALTINADVAEEIVDNIGALILAKGKQTPD